MTLPVLTDHFSTLAPNYDAVLSDVIMPSMDGHEFARWVARQYPETRTALMSGYDVGCRGCAYSPRCKMLAKPFSIEGAVAFVGDMLHAA